MAGAVVLGKGKITRRIGQGWEVMDGEHTFIVPPENMKISSPEPGKDGFLTYEFHLHHRAMREVFFRSCDDPVARCTPIPVGMARHH
jgi:hypothetical protein